MFFFDKQEIKEDWKKKPFFQLWGGGTMMTLFEHEGKITGEDTFMQAIRIQNALKGQINEVYPVYKLFCEMPLGKRSFTEFYPTVLDQPRLCNFEQHINETDVRDAIFIQTSNHKLRMQALTKGIDYANFIQYGLALESSSTQADTIEKTDSTINHVTRSDKKVKLQPPTRYTFKVGKAKEP